MNFTNALATGFTLILFVFMVLSLYEQVNVELFQQYKAVIFAGSMFLFLAILGLPYMEYDVAHRVPSFDFVSMAVGILAILCALFMYVFNMSFDTFVAGVSCAVIFFTVVSRVGNSDGNDGFPPFAKELLQFILIGSVVMGTFMAASAAVERGIPANPTLRGFLQFYAGAAPIGLWGMLVYAIYRAIRGLLDYRLTNLAPKPVGPYAPFEGFRGFSAGTTEEFQATAVAAEPKLLKDMKAAIDRVQDTLDQLVEQTDSTCAIIKEVEQGYVGAKSGPEDESEYKLPQDEQEKRKQSRQERAMKAFATNRKVYAATRNVANLECFQNAVTTTDATDYEISLRELCVQLHSLLENAETLAQIKKVQSMEAELEFADRQLNKSEGFQDSAPAVGLTPTQIYSTLRGETLDKAARSLLQKELNLYNSVTQIQNKVKNVRSRMGKSYQKINMVATGNYNVTEKDLLK
jgi:hypothetical protein